MRPAPCTLSCCSVVHIAVNCLQSDGAGTCWQLGCRQLPAFARQHYSRQLPASAACPAIADEQAGRQLPESSETVVPCRPRQLCGRARLTKGPVGHIAYHGRQTLWWICAGMRYITKELCWATCEKSLKQAMGYEGRCYHTIAHNSPAAGSHVLIR